MIDNIDLFVNCNHHGMLMFFEDESVLIFCQFKKNTLRRKKILFETNLKLNHFQTLFFST